VKPKANAHSDFGLNWYKLRMDEDKRIFARMELKRMREELKKLKNSS
jgi:hypothetical protein